jgi:hypothetical protein
MIVINSSPAINLTAALGSLELLANLYGTVIVPHAVFQELKAGATKDQTAQLLRTTPGVEIRPQSVVIPAWLTSILDAGEAAVIQSLKTGTTERVEAPSPRPGAGQLLIQTRRSLISAGTERMLVDFGKAGWVARGLPAPIPLDEVLEMSRVSIEVAKNLS